MKTPPKAPLIPDDEESRLTALGGLRILDTERERRFDDLIAELARKLEVPIAYLALMAEDRQWIKSKVGPMPENTRREDTFCNRTIFEKKPLLVANAASDPRFAGSELVAGPPHLRFYAGVPIQDPTGHTVGTVCVAGPEPRELGRRQLAILTGFARRVQEELATRPGVLLAYAAADEHWVARLLAAHPRLDDPGLVDLWSDERLAATKGRESTLKDALWGAASAVLMLSPSFLRSPFVRDPNFGLLCRARQIDPFDITPVVLEPCDPGTIDWLPARPAWPPGDRPLALVAEDEIDRLLRDLALDLAAEATGDDAPAATPPAAERPPQVFLSHAGEDTAAVKDLAARLRRGGVDVWLDADQLGAGDGWMQELEDALDRSDAFAVYIGRSGIARWIGPEVRVALDRNAKDPRFRFIPILGPGADPDSLPRFVAQHHWLDLRDGEAEPDEIRRLVAGILGRPAAAVSLLSPGEPPFRGLLTFDVEHTHLFFGRDRETRELVNALAKSPFLAVIGDSGSGKSSLVRAGLVPALHRGLFRDPTGESASWRVAILKPGGNPFRQLGNALLDLTGETSPSERMATLAAVGKQLETGTGGLCAALSALVPKGERTLLVIDQFEEVFTQSEDPDERDRFIDTLLEASNCGGDRPLHTLVTLRADFYSQCFEHPTLPSVLAAGQYPVRAIAADQLAEIIEKPAAMAGLTLEPGLVEAILVDIGDGPGNLPLLEHTLLELWKMRLSETLTHAAYEEIGRVQGALEHHAEEVFGAFGEQEKVLARQLLLGLVVPTENACPARRRATVDDVLPRDERRPAAEAVLQRLVEERLVMVRGSSSAGEDGADGADRDDREVEVAHEALLRGWDRLRGWLEEDREFLFWRQRTHAAFEAWEESRRDSGALLRGAPLVEARRWLEVRSDDLSREGRAFILESTALWRQQKRIRRAVVAAIGLSAVVSLVLALLATSARREAEESLLLATRAVDEMLTRVGSEDLEDFPQLEGVRQELLAKAETLYRQLGEQRASTPELELQAALAPARMAEIKRQLGEPRVAREELERAIEGLRELIAADPRRPEARLALSKVHNEMGRVLESSADLVTAAEHYGRGIEIQNELVASDPPRAEYAYELGRSHLNRGITRFKRQDFAGAEADYLGAIDSVAAFVGEPGEWSAEIRLQQGRSRNQLANTLARRNKNGEAVVQYERAIEIFEALARDHPESREYRTDLARAYRNLALHLRAHGDAGRAADHAAKAVTIFADLADALPDIRSEWAAAHQTQGVAFLELGRIPEATESLRRASQVYADLLLDYPERSDDLFQNAVTLLYLGSLRLDAGESSEVRRIKARLAEILPRLAPTARDRIERHPKYRQLQGAAP